MTILEETGQLVSVKMKSFFQSISDDLIGWSHILIEAYENRIYLASDTLNNVPYNDTYFLSSRAIARQSVDQLLDSVPNFNVSSL